MKLGMAEGMAAIGMLLLAGCNSSSSVTGTTYDLNAAISGFVRTKHDYTLTAAGGGNTYVDKLSHVPGPSGSLGTLKGETTVDSNLLFENGTLIRSNAITHFYNLNPYVQIGDYDATTGYVSVYRDQLPLPTAAASGQSGTLSSSTTYYDTSLTTVFGTEEDTWTLQASGADAMLCLDFTDHTASGDSTESDCYTIDSSNQVLAVTITVVLNGVTLTFK